MQVIEFSTSHFLPFLPESCQVNPGVYGFELAYWLSRSLLSKGFITSYPESEDWGWYIEYINGDVEISIGCSSQANDGDGYFGTSIDWAIFVKQHISFRQKLKGVRESQQVEDISKAISLLLAAEGIVTGLSDGVKYGQKR